MLFIEQVYAARSDLNGDGIQELLLTFVNLRWCGNQGNCGTFIYKKDGWRYRGTVQAWETGNPGDFENFYYGLVLLPQAHNGWRVLGAPRPDGAMYCWSRIVEFSASEMTPFGEPVPEGSEGYSTAVSKEDGICR